MESTGENDLDPGVAKVIRSLIAAIPLIKSITENTEVSQSALRFSLRVLCDTSFWPKLL
jgi:hypothetical protein